MKKWLRGSLTGLGLAALLLTEKPDTGVAGNIAIDKTAPNFTLTDHKGKKVSLSDFKGKYVVLEWINYECPFDVKHYATGNM